MARTEGKASDGSGGVNEQFVNANGRAGVDALTQTHQNTAVEEGNGFTLYSTYSATGGEEVWFLQNDGRDIAVDSIEVSTSASGIFTVLRQTSGTAVGTVMQGRNMKAGIAILDDVTAFGSASVTGSVDGDDITGHDIATTTPYVFNMHEYVLPKGQAIFVRTATNGIVHVTGFVHVD